MFINKPCTIQKASETQGSVVIEWDGEGPAVTFDPGEASHQEVIRAARKGSGLTIAIRQGNLLGINIRRKGGGEDYFGFSQNAGLVVCTGAMLVGRCAISNCEGHGVIVMPKVPLHSI